MLFNSGGDDIRGHRYPGHRGAAVPPVCHPEIVVGRRVGDVLAHDAVLAPHWALDKDGYTRFVVLSSFFCFNVIPGSYYILIHVIMSYRCWTTAPVPCRSNRRILDRHVVLHLHTLGRTDEHALLYHPDHAHSPQGSSVHALARRVLPSDVGGACDAEDDLVCYGQEVVS
jgi:hypothetical protein